MLTSPASRVVTLALPVLVGLGSAGGIAQPITAPDPGSLQRRTAVVEVADRFAMAVVNVHSDEVVQTRVRSGDFFQDFMAPRYREEYATTSLGSGVLVDPHHVVTNHHVVANGSRIRVSLSDRREYACTLVGSDPDLDIAVLRLQTEEDLPHIQMAESTDVLVGETVIAIGNPFGLGHTVTTGVVSALHRTVQAPERIYHDFLQTDASINPGNSGGPLLDVHGRLVGINTAIYGRAQGIGFAIPVNRVRRIADEIIATGGIRQGHVGLELQPLLRDKAKELGLLRPDGVLVAAVAPGGPAEKAGVKAGDVILTMEDFPALDDRHFGAKMRDYPPGTKLQLGLWREGAATAVTVETEPLPQGFARQVFDKQLGVTISVVTDDNADEHKVGDVRGLVITGIREKSAGERARLKLGDRIDRVGADEIKDDATFDRSLAESRRHGGLVLGIEREGRKLNTKFAL